MLEFVEQAIESGAKQSSLEQF
ncbi:protein of unknown function [Aminobacter niigataensis]|nr:protein of unknown function [Aminobacter niigataensis]